MSSDVFFDDIDTNPAAEKKPFFAALEKSKSDDDLLTWLKQEFASLKDDYRPWHEEIKNNYKRYKEIQYRDQLYAQRDLPDRKNRFMPQVVAPLVRDITDERIARMMEYKPAVAILPQHDESQDKTDAKVAKRFIKHLEKEQNLDSKFIKFLRTTYVAGEGYIVTRWNPDKGYLMPEAKKMSRLVFVGDVEFKVFSPLRVMFERCDDEMEPEYCFLVEFDYADKLKKQYPSSADKIKADGRITYYDPDTMEDKTEAGKCMKITFWHKKTPYLPEGYECVFTDNAILKKADLPYEHGKLPVASLKDNENMEEQFGRSWISSLKGMIGFYNNMLNMTIKQLSLASWAKWFVDAGSIDDQALNNDLSIVKIQPGSRNPVLSQGNPVSQQMLGFMDKSLEIVYKWGKSNSIIQGEPPPGVTAFVALQFMSESESRRLNSHVIKFNEAVRTVYELALTTCGQYYKKEDQRTMLILGKDSSWLSQSYDPSSLAKPYSILIQNASALPDSKGARTQYVLDLAKQFPQLFPPEQILEMLDLAQSEKFANEGSAAARSAEAENELMTDGKEVMAPEAHENLVVHWKIHFAAMQDYAFKTKANPEVQQAFKDHLLATEFLMMEQAQKSPLFAQGLQTLVQFPIYMTPPPLPPMVDPSQPLDGALPPPQEGFPPEQGMGGEPMPPTQEEMPPIADNQIQI